MTYLTNLANTYTNPGHVLLTRRNNLGVYKVNDEYQIWDVIENTRWISHSDIEEACKSLNEIYYNNPLVLLCEPDGTLWHDTGIITNVAVFMASTLKLWQSVSIIAVPDELEG